VNNKYTYNNKIGVVPPIIPSIDPVSLAINAAIIALPFVIKSLAHPARDEKNRIENLKRQVGGMDATNRLRFVIENSAQTTAPDVTAREWFLWYRKTYNEDYKILSYNDKILFNDFMAQFGNRFAQNVDTLQSCKLAMFNVNEINYNLPITESAIFQNPTTQKYLLIGAIGLGLLLLLNK
jgi:hypothetical protein